MRLNIIYCVYLLHPLLESESCNSIEGGQDETYVDNNVSALIICFGLILNNLPGFSIWVVCSNRHKEGQNHHNNGKNQFALATKNFSPWGAFASLEFLWCDGPRWSSRHTVILIRLFKKLTSPAIHCMAPA